MELKAGPGGEFSLIDHDGQAVTQESYRGHYRLVFFGFTHCRVVCPRNLARLSHILEALGPRAEEIRPLYVSVDPERDTPEVMKDFLARNYPRFTGLTGSRALVDHAKQSFRVFAERKADPDDPDGYAVPHTAITYLMDRNGGYLAHFPESLPEQEVLQRISALLDSASSPRQ